MRTWTIKLAALVAVAVVGLAAAQQPAKPDPKPAPAPAKPDPNSLEGAIATALKNNPDIKHAEAKVNEATAGLNQARLQVMKSVVTAHSALELAKQTLRLAEKQLEQTNELSQKNAGISKFELQKAEADVGRIKAEVASAEAQLALLLGNIPGQREGRVSWLNELQTHTGRVSSVTFSPDGERVYTGDSSGTVRVWDTKTGRALDTPDGKFLASAGSMDGRIRDALTKTVKIDNWKEALPVADVIEYLKKKAGADIPFRLLIENSQTHKSPRTVDLMTGELPLSAWLAVIEDSVPDVVFVVREYGILVTPKDRMPSDGLRVRQFLQRTEPKKDEAKKQ